MQVILLGAGKPNNSNQPSALKKIGLKMLALDWQIQAFKKIDKKIIINFLGGFQFQKIKKQYPKINCKRIKNWKNNNILNTFLQSNFISNSLIVSYSDTIFRKNIYSDILKINGDVVFAVDTEWKKRYLHRTQEDINKAEKILLADFDFKTQKNAEFTGLILFRKNGLDYIKKNKKKIKGENLIDLIKILCKNNFVIKFTDIKNNWSEFNSEQDLARFMLGTKSETLHRLKPLLKKSTIGKQYSFTVDEWTLKKNKIYFDITKKFQKNFLIVRSSSFNEDSWQKSNAGAFKSILEVDSSNQNKIFKAIDDVIKSYGKNKSKNDQVFIQTQIKNVLLSGVVFTCDLESGLPIYKINFDQNTGNTNSITSGKSKDSRCIIINKNNFLYLYKKYFFLKKLINAIKEIENNLNYYKLDIEFAIDKFHKIHIFQIRPITIDHSKYKYVQKNQIYKKLNYAKNNFIKLQKSGSNIIGNKTIFGNMPDWNPAEIIGIKPKPLALDLYKYLITNTIWSKQRSEYGYRNLKGNPLLVEFCNQPFIDVRASLNSFIPKDIPDKIAKKLYNAYLKILINKPSLHDKIEFEVVFTSWIPNFRIEALKRLKLYGVNIEEVKILENSLKKITSHGLIRLNQDIKNIEVMNEKRKMIIKSKKNHLSKFINLIKDCKKFGTISFAHSARAGFIAIILLKSFLKNNILSSNSHNKFMKGIHTVSKELENISNAKSVFKKFGHLRPGTYEISNKAYWENPNFYFNTNSQFTKKIINKKFIPNKKEKQKIQLILKEMGSDISSTDLVNFLYQAIESRELIKFEFSKNLSLGLDYLSQFGKNNNLTRKELSYLKLSDINKLINKKLKLTKIKKLLEMRSKDINITNLINLPSLITDQIDFYIFEQNKSLPNYISLLSKTGEILNINNKINYDFKIKNLFTNKIILIESADPGFDWIFRYNIIGLITKFGGANSHMAIRSAEKNLPAAIGVGETLYQNLNLAKIIKIDCKNKMIEIIK